MKTGSQKSAVQTPPLEGVGGRLRFCNEQQAMCRSHVRTRKKNGQRYLGFDQY